MDAAAVLQFWFDGAGEERWWAKDAAFDSVIAERFGALHARAAAGELWHWRTTAQGRLAEIIVLDQFSRNIFRGRAQSFAQDRSALILAQEAVYGSHDLGLPVAHRMFMYMPFMHSESAPIHAEALRLFALPGMADNLEYEHQHKAIIDRFGRYPHRNAILGRESTIEELAFLQLPGSDF
ncbi:MAG: DUF924 family protein [Betaproteobacteria bacterium]